MSRSLTPAVRSLRSSLRSLTRYTRSNQASSDPDAHENYFPHALPLAPFLKLRTNESHSSFKRRSVGIFKRQKQ